MSGGRANAPMPPDSELEEEAIRPASGPGGQHVNRTACAIRLTYRFEGSSVLSYGAQERLRTICGSRVSGGCLAIVAKEYRSLEDNRRAARERLLSFIAEAIKVPKRRRATKPTRSSKERRLKEKSARSQIKKGRGSSHGED